MNIRVNNFNIFLIIAVTFLISVILTPITKKIANHIGAIDYPNSRKIHKTPKPRLGGLAIYISFILGYALFGEVNTQMISIFIGGFIIILLGLIDDIKSVPARYKFIVQLIVAIFVVLYGQIYFSEITFLGLKIYINKYISYILSSIFIVAITNSINIIDGLDGLAAGISSIYFLTIAIIAFILNRIGGLDIILSIIMLGATLGFLPYNFPPAKIFMGDTGSLFLGYMISIIALLGFKIATITSLIVPLCILGIPIFDTVLAIFRRLLKHKNIGIADKEHFHHQLLKLKYSPIASILIIYFVDILFASVSIFFVLGDTKMAIFLYVALMIMLLFLILKTDILYEHKNKKEKNIANN